jgi:retinol dehydrogenase 12
MNDARSMKGKVCLVTGATSGLGLETARAIANRGATVVILSRNSQRCAATAKALREESHSTVEPLTADLSVQAEIRRAAREFQERFSRLDVLVNNAGAGYPKREESADGIERTWALNHLSYFLRAGPDGPQQESPRKRPGADSKSVEFRRSHSMNLRLRRT